MEQHKLIKLALLGNREAAKRLTDAGVLVPCPGCGGENAKHMTLEQLREMDSIPIWVVDTTINRREWCYWKGGLAYRRPPEGEEAHHG